MSSLSDLVRGGAVGAGTGSTRTSPSGSHHGASDSLLPSLSSSVLLGSLGRQEGDESLPLLPSLTAGGVRSSTLTTPRQLDSFMHGGDNASATGDWLDAMESTTGSMGGESTNNGVVRVFCVKEGAGKDMCCGQVGAKGGARFCTSSPSDCKFKNHEKKANVKPHHVYLGSDSGRKSTGWMGWCMPVEVFGGRDGQLSGLGLDGAQFRRFGETLQGLYVGGKEDMTTISWDPILAEISRPLDYGATPRKVQFSMRTGGAIESTGLSNWMNLGTPASDGGEEGAEGSLDKSTENDYQVLEKLTTLSANSEVLKEALEQQSTANGKTSGEIGDLINLLSAQIHDVSVRVGDNPGFVGSKHDSTWNGITRVQENLDTQEAAYTKQLNDLVASSVKASIESFKREMSRENTIRDAERRDLKKQISDLQGLSAAHSSLMADVSILKQDVGLLKLAATPALPPSFNADYPLMLDFFMRNTTRLDPPAITLVGNSLEKSVRESAAAVSKLAVDLGNVSLSSGAAPSLTSHLSGGGPSWVPTKLAAPGAVAALESQVLDLKARMASKSVTIGDFTFPTLAGTCAWAKANLPSSPDQANICVDVVVLLHSIGCEFATIDETRDTLYQNKRAGVSSMALTVASSFNTVLPQIMGKSKHSTNQDSGLVLPCAPKYSDWFDNTTGISTGIKPRIMEGLSTQMAVYEEAIRHLGYSHPEAAAMAHKLLRRAYDCAILLLGLIETMWNEYMGRSGEVGKDEAWQIICALVRQFFRELCNVRRPGAAINSAASESVGTTWWYVLQTHRLMDEFVAADIRRHPSLIPVFTTHLDRNRVTLTTHAALADKVQKMAAAVASVTTSVNKLNGARGNPGGGRGGGGAAGAP